MASTHGGGLDAGLHLMDRQIIDVEGRMVAKVDDVELQQLADGTWAVTALLVGPGVLGPRLGGLLGDAVASTWRRLVHKDRSEPGRIDISDVVDIGSAITLSVSRDVVAVDGFEAWTRTHVIEGIPGNFHEPEE